MATLEQKFQAAVDIVQKLPKEGPVSTSNDQKLRFYSLYKQATVGDVNTERPGFFSFVERAKWDAWKSVEGTVSEKSKEIYIEELVKLIEQLRSTINIKEWVNSSEIDPSVKTNFEILGIDTNH